MTRYSNTMQRTHSWLSILCRFVGLVDEEPILPIRTPVRSDSDSGSGGSKSPVGFELDGLGMIENGRGGSSVFVPMTSRKRHGMIQHA